MSSVGLLMALPIAVWEFSVGVYMTVKGFRTPPASDGSANVVPAPAALPTPDPVVEISDVTKR